MNHTTIERERYIDRYLLAQLSEDEAERFEEHYLGCAQCLEELETAEQLQLGLKQAATEDIAKVTGALSFWAQLSRLARQYPGALVGALVVLLLLPAGLGWQLSRLQGELDATQAQLTSAQAPQTGTRIAYLDQERSAPGSDSVPSQQIQLPAEPGWIVLAVQLEPGHTVAAELHQDEGEVLWQASRLTADSLGRLNISLHSSQLQPGDYRLGLQSEDHASSILEYAFRILASP